MKVMKPALSLAAASGGPAVCGRRVTRQDRSEIFYGLVDRASSAHRARRSRARQASGRLKTHADVPGLLHVLQLFTSFMFKLFDKRFP